MTDKVPLIYVWATDLRTRLTFGLEQSRRGSRKFRAFVMPATGRELDKPVTHLGRVPLEIRQSIRALLELAR